MSDTTDKKPEGLEQDPYEWGKCAVTASIVWLPDGTVMLGARTHLDAPIVSLLAADSLTSLPGHAAELPIPSVQAIADMLAELREELPLRAQAKAERERKAEEAKSKAASGKKGKSASSQSAPAPISAPAKLPPIGNIPPAGHRPPAGKAPAGNQISMFNFMTGGN